MVSACGSGKGIPHVTTKSRTGTPSSSIATQNLVGSPVPFSPRSPWLTPIPASAAPARDSQAIVANLNEQIHRYYGHVAFNETSYSATLYTVGPNQPRVRMAFDNCDKLKQEPAGFRQILSSVPIPKGAVGSMGTDSETSIYQPSTHHLWEFWVFKRNAAGRYSACWGGEITNTSTNLGIFPPPYGATASGLPLAGFLVRISDLQKGSINHTLGLEVPRAHGLGRYSWPANRTDGWLHTPTLPMEGQRFRLNPRLNLASLHLNPIALMVAKALQKYGVIVTDQSGTAAIQAQDPRPYEAAHGGQNPYETLSHNTPQYGLLNGIPWNQLQAMPPDYGKPS